ncbi:MAG: rhomboid family intramembrane serine protease [Elusimicrobia bacterium]|nr:rhomboid family intramembrane serine protease [Elusimicrobiota bacterium]
MIPLRDNINSRTIPFVNYLLIFANILAFYYQLNLNSLGQLDSLIRVYGIVPHETIIDPFGNLSNFVTSQFLHGGWMHLIGNMLYLYIFGDNVEDKIGHIRYFIFYLLSGVAASISQIYFNQNSLMPMIGASGAIAGVLGAYFVLFPRARVLTLIPFGYFTRIVEIPAIFFLGFWFLMQTFSGTASLQAMHAVGRDIGGVAWFAHAGGFLFGFAYVIFRKLSRNF